MTQIWADISGNHGGKLDRARGLIYEAAWAGCAAVKFQAYKPDDMDSENRAIYEKYAVPVLWYPLLFQTAIDCKIPIFASVFGLWAIKVLEGYGCSAYKFAARYSTELPRERYKQMAAAIKETGKTFIVSSCDDMEWARSFSPDIILHCPAGHPSQINESHLKFVHDHKLGCSDHSADIVGALAMAKVGATHIEKHLKLRGDHDCIDAAFSVDPDQMKTLCDLAS